MMKGTLRVYLRKSSGDVLPITLVYNGAAEPSASLSLELEDWIALHTKETTGQALFVSGRLSFTGDMHFLMRLQTLLQGREAQPPVANPG
jgi:predicted lipid carrier protein YhbT